MRISALLAALFVAGLLTSLALASPAKHEKPETTTSGAAPKPKCDQVELKGLSTAGSISLKVTKANKQGRNLVDTTVSLVIPANAKVKAKACSSAGGLTLRDLHVKVAPAKP